MLEAPGAIASPLALVLDVADKLIKLIAVAPGGIGTHWNCRKSRTYARKLELTASEEIFEAS
jgi:hypothetical protein